MWTRRGSESVRSIGHDISRVVLNAFRSHRIWTCEFVKQEVIGDHLPPAPGRVDMWLHPYSLFRSFRHVFSRDYRLYLLFNPLTDKTAELSGKSWIPVISGKDWQECLINILYKIKMQLTVKHECGPVCSADVIYEADLGLAQTLSSDRWNQTSCNLSVH